MGAVLPPFTNDDVLPCGDYALTLAELRQCHLVSGVHSDSLTWNVSWRDRLVTNLSIIVRQLWQVGIDQIFVDGSFVENKDHPHDIDGYFEVDERRLVTGQLQGELNAVDPYQTWTWDHRFRRPDPNSTKLQLPMWHQYRVEMYPHFGQSSGVADQYGNPLQFPAAFRKSRSDDRPKGIVKVIK